MYPDRYLMNQNTHFVLKPNLPQQQHQGATIYGAKRNAVTNFIDHKGNQSFKSREVRPVLLEQYERNRARLLAEELTVTGSSQLAAAFNKLQEQSLTQMRKFLSVNQMRSAVGRLKKPMAPTPTIGPRVFSPDAMWINSESPRLIQSAAKAQVKHNKRRRILIDA